MALKFLSGNRLTLLRNGEQYFPALVAAFDAASREIFFETYIFADDQTGSLVADALARAAARGVAVQVVLDGFGARDFAPRFRQMLDSAGAKVLVFRPKISPLTLKRNRLRRMHRKLAVVDSECAFVGGINVIDDYGASGEPAPRYDYAVCIQGPLVDDVWLEAARLWSRLAWVNYRRRWRLPTGRRSTAVARGSERAALVVRDSFRHRRDIEDAYIEMIDAAQIEILIAIAYFLPGRRFRRALRNAAKRGVKVVLLVQGRTDHPLMSTASRSLFGAFLETGMNIHEYTRSEMHAKVAVFDARTACVGSSNIDPFSLLLAREANVFVDDAPFALALRASLLEAIAGARQVPVHEWKQQPFWVRARIEIAYAFARLLMSLAGTQEKY